MKHFIYIALVAVSLAFVSCDSLQSRGISPGERAPELSFNDLDGNPFSLEQLKGKVVLINFWASWCAPCIIELPALQRLHQRFKDRGFAVLGVGVDDTAENLKQIKNEYGLSFPIIGDFEGKSKRDYKITGFPESLIIDSQGKVVMIVDSEDKQPTAKIEGPREWEDKFFTQQIEKLLPAP